jgi:hypothetical protein
MLLSPLRSALASAVRSPLEAGRRRASIIDRLLSAGSLRFHHSVDAALRRNLAAGVWGQSSGWTAGQLAQCAAFQDAAGTTPVWAHEQPLGLLLDLSGRGIHLSQPTNTVSRPLVRWADTSAPACARFDGFDDWLQHAALDLTNTDEVTVVGGLRKASDAATGCFYEQSASSSSGSGKIAVFAPIANGQPAVTFRSRGSLSSDATATGIPAPVNLVFAGEGSRGGDLARLRINGTVSAEVTSDQGGTGYGNEVGFVGRRNGASQPFNGDFYGLSLCDRLLSASDLAELERLHGRLTGSMP